VLRLVFAIVLLVGAPAVAAETDPDTEVAQRLFAEGASAYDAHDYARALERFEAARRLKPLPAFDYNIARCHDRLGQPGPALAAYERYLAAVPDAPDAAEVRARVAVLRGRVEPAPATTPATATPAAEPPRTSHRLIAPVVVGVAGVALFATGAGLVGSVGGDYDALQRRWQLEGPTSGVVQTADALHARELAGWTLFGIGAAALAADVVLWILATHRHERPQQTARAAVLTF
jgi:tetratricopeptide (TPR) repeat protein